MAAIDDRGQFGTRRSALARGIAVAFGVPGLILFASAAGFGALARDAGLSLGNANLMMATLFALPAQVVMVDQLARGGSLLGAALAVTLIGVRLLPMTAVLAPHLGGPSAGRLGKVIAVHAIAITAWMEGFRRLPSIAEPLRLPHFLGIGAGLILASLAGTTAGFAAAGVVPPAFAAALLFLTPIYFMLSLIETAGGAGDWLAIAIGAALGPLSYLFAPGFDLLLTGVVGGTAAYLLGRRWRGMWRLDGHEDTVRDELRDGR